MYLTHSLYSHLYLDQGMNVQPDAGTHCCGTFCCLGTKVTKRASMPAYFVTNEIVTNRAAVVLFVNLDIRIYIVCVGVCVCVCV